MLIYYILSSVFQSSCLGPVLQSSTEAGVFVVLESCVLTLSSRLFSFSPVNCVCPRCSCFALSHVLAAHLHPCAAPASSGLLLVRLTTSERNTHTQ